MNQRSSVVVGVYIVGAVQLLLLLLILLRMPASIPMPGSGPRVDVDLTPVLNALEEIRGDLKVRHGLKDRSVPERTAVEGTEPQHDELLAAVEKLREQLARDLAAFQVASGRFAADVSDAAKLFPSANGVAVMEFAQLYERDEDAARSTLLLRTMPEILTRFGSPTEVLGGRGIVFEYEVEISGSEYDLRLVFTNGLVRSVSANVRDV